MLNKVAERNRWPTYQIFIKMWVSGKPTLWPWYQVCLCQNLTFTDVWSDTIHCSRVCYSITICVCVTFFACFLLHNIQCYRLCNIIKSLLVDQDISTFGITKPNVLGSSTGYVFFFFFWGTDVFVLHDLHAGSSLFWLLYNANVAVAVRLLHVYLNMFLPGILTLIN